MRKKETWNKKIKLYFNQGLFVSLMLILVACGQSDFQNFKACGDYSDPLFLGGVDHENLSEISGLAVSRKNPGVVWLHNDSKNAAVIYAVNFKSQKILGKIILDGVTQVDWEDIALGPCGSAECIFIGDIGDNQEERGKIQVYQIQEPDLDPNSEFDSILLKDFITYNLLYGDKAHNAEAIALHPNGSLYLFTKENGKSSVFKTPELTASHYLQLEYVGVFKTGPQKTDMVTAADIHRSGKRLLLRTNTKIFEFRSSKIQEVSEILKLKPIEIKSGQNFRGEAIAYDPRSGHIIHSSEAAKKKPAPLHEIKCKD